MSSLFVVEVDAELIREFIEELESALYDAEGHIISLEKDSFDVKNLQLVRNIFFDLWIGSVKLSLTPLSESLDDAIKAIDKLIEWLEFPLRMGEFLLLLMDRILYLSRELERNFVIDMRETQNILVSLQRILLINSPAEIEEATYNAIDAITRNIDLITEDPFAGFSVDLFGEDNPLSVEKDDKTKLVDVYVPKKSISPILYAKDVIASMKQDTAIALLANISDQATSHGDSHTQFLLEVGLGINYMMGEQIAPENLVKGICLHDIALSSLIQILNKPDKLTKEEIQLIREHPTNGVSIARAMQMPEEAVNIILHHHERMDGNGYPNGLKGDQISDGGKIVGIVDSFHGMFEKRAHKRFTRSSLRAIAEINACVDSHYDKLWIKQFNIFMKKHWLPMKKKNDLDR